MVILVLCMSELLCVFLSVFLCFSLLISLVLCEDRLISWVDVRLCPLHTLLCQGL